MLQWTVGSTGMGSFVTSTPAKIDAVSDIPVEDKIMQYQYCINDYKTKLTVTQVHEENCDQQNVGNGYMVII